MKHKFEICKKKNSSLWTVRERMGNAFISHWVDVFHSGYDDCRAYVAARR